MTNTLIQDWQRFQLSYMKHTTCENALGQFDIYSTIFGDKRTVFAITLPTLNLHTIPLTDLQFALSLSHVNIHKINGIYSTSDPPTQSISLEDFHQQ